MGNNLRVGCSAKLAPLALHYGDAGSRSTSMENTADANLSRCFEASQPSPGMQRALEN